MNYKLLLDLFHIGSPSYEEEKVSSFVQSYLRKNGISFTADDIGNVYSLKYANAPILSAHLDTVQDTFDVFLAKYITIRKNILSGYGVIGGDDKCGVYIILDLILQKKFNFVLSVGEETGGFGMRHFLSENDISGCSYGLVLDRRGNDDIICYRNDYGTKKFEDSLSAVGEVYGYSPGTGTFSDADQINEQISCANLSVGYFNPHTKSEFVLLADLKKAEDYVFSILKNITDKFERPVKYTSNYNNCYGMGAYDWEDDKDNLVDEMKCLVCGKMGYIYLQTLDKFICDECAPRLAEDLEYAEIYKAL